MLKMDNVATSTNEMAGNNLVMFSSICGPYSVKVDATPRPPDAQLVIRTIEPAPAALPAG
jgi:hypothetical protein